MGNAQSSSSARETAEEEERENSTTTSGRREGEEVIVEMSSASSPRSQSAEGEEEKNEEAKRKEDEEEEDGEEETEEENRIVASCRVCLEPIRKSDVMIENNSACLLGCKCSQVGIHLNRECGIKYLKNLQRPNQTLTLCEVCQSPMSEFATKIQPVLNATTKKSLVYAGHVERRCARCRANGSALNIKTKHESYPGGFLCNKCKVYDAFDDPRGCGVCCNRLYGYKLTLPEMEQILKGDGTLKFLKLRFPPNESPLDRDVCGICWCMLRTELRDMAKREREAAYDEMFLKSGNTQKERTIAATKRLALRREELEEALDALRVAIRAAVPSSEMER